MSNLYNSLMAYRQRRGPQMNRQMGRPMGQQQPAGGMPAQPMQAPAPQMPPMQAPALPPRQAPAPQMGGGMPAPQAPGGYDSSGINPSAGRPFQLQGGFASQRLPQSSQPVLFAPQQPPTI